MNQKEVAGGMLEEKTGVLTARGEGAGTPWKVEAARRRDSGPQPYGVVPDVPRTCLLLLVETQLLCFTQLGGVCLTVSDSDGGGTGLSLEALGHRGPGLLSASLFATPRSPGAGQRGHRRFAHFSVANEACVPAP